MNALVVDARSVSRGLTEGRTPDVQMQIKELRLGLNQRKKDWRACRRRGGSVTKRLSRFEDLRLNGVLVTEWDPERRAEVTRALS